MSAAAVALLERDFNRVCGERDRARKALAALLDALEDRINCDHSAECGCDRCEAIAAAKKELGK